MLDYATSPSVAFGCMGLHPDKRKASIAAVGKALQLGFTHFDNADLYPGPARAGAGRTDWIDQREEGAMKHPRDVWYQLMVIGRGRPIPFEPDPVFIR